MRPVEAQHQVVTIIKTTFTFEMEHRLHEVKLGCEADIADNLHITNLGSLLKYILLTLYLFAAIQSIFYDTKFLKYFI